MYQTNQLFLSLSVTESDQIFGKQLVVLSMLQLKKAYNGEKRIEWKEVLAGQKAYDNTGEWLPQETLDTIKEYLIAVKGPLTTQSVAVSVH